MSGNYAEIVELIGKYFDLLYNGDTGLIEEVFLPQAHVFSIVDGTVVDADMSRFYERIATRPPPALTNEVRRDRIISIDISGLATALARVDLLILPAGHYTDYLSLLKVEGKWKIVCKVFHFEPAAQPQESE
jgi:4-oxalocrotonate tautomerase